MKILIAGDFCPQHRVVDLFDKKEYDFVLGDVKPILKDVDYSVLNFECAVTKGTESPITKCGPNLCCTEEGLKAISWAGFNCVTLANNHILDYGRNGLKNTIEKCKELNLDTVGVGENLCEASKVLYKNINGEVLAVINCCEHEFSIATESTAGSNPLNSIKQFYEIQEAKNNADYVVVIVHGGNEHCPYPSVRMQETYRFFIDAGADAVINHHQHCVNGYELYKGHPIFYGLGNFCFDNNLVNKDSWYLGYMVKLDLSKGNIVDFKVMPYTQCKDETSIKLLTGKEKLNFFSHIDDLNEHINNPVQLNRKWEEWVMNSGKWVLPLFEPWQTRITRALFGRGFLPSKLKGERKIQLINLLNCESHVDRLRFLLKIY
jgi:poly-gamma-glutamate synthesis protein (capsule biosynthesis protein)